MSTIAIDIQGLGKRYRIGQLQSASSVLGRLAYPLRSRRNGPAAASPSHPDFIWALHDINLQVERGSVFGIIGPNGAGKSTLLKILARITEPTEGRAMIRGKMSSLLEVGTGFHGELTGRENIFLNGIILGMTRAEIARKFDDIVGFAGIDDFIDTPLKRYSSGMYVRLAFAVASHLDTEILLVDEVLAVGDAGFQMKSLNKMSEITSSGRTILFVSHNMAAISQVCNHAALLANGRVEQVGTPLDCIQGYLSVMENGKTSGGVISLVDHPGRKMSLDGPVELTKLMIVDEHGKPSRFVGSGRPFTARIGYNLKSKRAPQNATFHIIFSNVLNQRIASCRSVDTLGQAIKVTGPGEAVCRIPRLPLIPGSYRINVGCMTEAGYSDGVYDAAVVEVSGSSFYESGLHPGNTGGDVLFDHEWEIAHS